MPEIIRLFPDAVHLEDKKPTLKKETGKYVRIILAYYNLLDFHCKIIYYFQVMNFDKRVGAKSVKNTQLITSRVVPKGELYETTKSKYLYYMFCY